MYYFLSQFRQVESCTDNGLYCQAYLDSRRPCILLSLETGVLPGIQFVKKRIDFEPTKGLFVSGLTRTEIVGNSMLLLMVGYLSTAMTMAFLAYSITVDHEVQEKVYQEIEDSIEEQVC